MLILGALCVGLSLGLLGSGGSILTVPILVYALGQGEKEAIAGSLAIVAGISALAAIPYALRRQIAWRSVLLFGLPGMAGAWIGSRIAEGIPGAVQLAIFAVVMLVAAGFMLLRSNAAEPSGRDSRAAWKIALDGIGVGLLTGLVGVGGGFLIVPALVLLGGLPMSLAVGTSLVIIAGNAATGFVAHLGTVRTLGIELDTRAILTFIALGGLGALAGHTAGRRLPQATLRRIFAIGLLALGVYVLWRNLPGALGRS